MSPERKSIEYFFLDTLLKITMAGIFIILAATLLLYPEDIVSILICMVVLGACAITFWLKYRYPAPALLLFTSIVLLSMIYQCLVFPFNATNTLPILLVVGFIFSVMLKGPILWGMHALTLISVQGIFVYQAVTPQLKPMDVNPLAAIGVTYTILYVILASATAVLKSRYDHMNHDLKLANIELREKADEIEAQNEELVQTQNNLHALNEDLEKLVYERTTKIQAQNEMLIKYSYANAHHLRGPVARLLGLAALSEIGSGLG